MTPAFAVRLAWRNVWRRKRRTLLTAAAIATAMLLTLFMRSMQEGSYAHNLDNATRLFSGYLQLQRKGFDENKSIDYLLPADADFQARVMAIPGATEVVPRLESFALGAAGDRSKGVLVMGISPAEEDAYSGLSSRVTRGSYWKNGGENGVILGSRLAQYFGLEVGDEFVLYGQGYHGATAAGVFPVRGIVRYPTAPLDSRIVFLPLREAQHLYAAGSQVTAWVLHGRSVHDIPTLLRNARDWAPEDVAVRSWAEISPELDQQVRLDRASGQFLVIVLYGVVGFGLFATIVMMTMERRREFAVMLATGMPRWKLQVLVVLESFLLAITGVILGLAVTVPVLVWFYFHPIPLTGDVAKMMEELGWEPIMPFSLAPRLFFAHIGVVLALLTGCVGYPLARVGRMSVPDSLRK